MKGGKPRKAEIGVTNIPMQIIPVINRLNLMH